MTALRSDTGHGTPGPARARYEQLVAESRSITTLPDGDLLVRRLMDGLEVWHPTTQPLRADTQCRLVSDARPAAPTVSPSVAPTSTGVALATSSADAVGVPAAGLSPGSTPEHVPHGRRTPAHEREPGHTDAGEGGEPVRDLSSGSGATGATRRDVARGGADAWHPDLTLGGLLLSRTLQRASTDTVPCDVCGRITHEGARVLRGSVGHDVCLVWRAHPEHRNERPDPVAAGSGHAGVSGGRHA